jgi:hypothetical protein
LALSLLQVTLGCGNRAISTSDEHDGGIVLEIPAPLSRAAAALGIQTIEHHHRKVRFFSTIELINALETEKAKGKTGQIAENLTKLGLVTLDELGYLPFSASGGALQCPSSSDNAVKRRQA